MNRGDAEIAEDVMAKGSRANYERVLATLGDLPQTWYPAVLIHLVECSYKQRVFRPGGASLLVAKLERKLGLSASSAKSAAKNLPEQP